MNGPTSEGIGADIAKPDEQGVGIVCLLFQAGSCEVRLCHFRSLEKFALAEGRYCEMAVDSSIVYGFGELIPDEIPPAFRKALSNIYASSYAAVQEASGEVAGAHRPFDTRLLRSRADSRPAFLRQPWEKGLLGSGFWVGQRLSRSWGHVAISSLFHIAARLKADGKPCSEFARFSQDPKAASDLHRYARNQEDGAA